MFYPCVRDVQIMLLSVGPLGLFEMEWSGGCSAKGIGYLENQEKSWRKKNSGFLEVVGNRVQLLLARPCVWQASLTGEKFHGSGRQVIGHRPCGF
jgi:hypothetical protein